MKDFMVWVVGTSFHLICLWTGITQIIEIMLKLGFYLMKLRSLLKFLFVCLSGTWHTNRQETLFWWTAELKWRSLGQSSFSFHIHRNSTASPFPHGGSVLVRPGSGSCQSPLVAACVFFGRTGPSRGPPKPHILLRFLALHAPTVRGGACCREAAMKISLYARPINSVCTLSVGPWLPENESRSRAGQAPDLSEEAGRFSKVRKISIDSDFQTQ